MITLPSYTTRAYAIEQEPSTHSGDTVRLHPHHTPPEKQQHVIPNTNSNHSFSGVTINTGLEIVEQFQKVKLDLPFQIDLAEVNEEELRARIRKNFKIAHEEVALQMINILESRERLREDVKKRVAEIRKANTRAKTLGADLSAEAVMSMPEVKRK